MHYALLLVQPYWICSSHLQPPVEDVCDPSSIELGAVLNQDGRPTTFWAKHLSEAEHNYAVGEQECWQLCMHLSSGTAILMVRTFSGS